MYREPTPPPPDPPPPAPEESYRALLWGVGSIVLVPAAACTGLVAEVPVDRALNGNGSMLFSLVPGTFAVIGAILVGRELNKPLKNPFVVAPSWSVAVGWMLLVMSTAVTLPLSWLLWVGTHMGSPGRPFRGWLGTQRARAMNRADWNAPLSTTPREVDRRLATKWKDAALAEHASVASFAQLSLDLLELGAPPELIRRCHLAAIDEIDHAQKSFALASAYAGEAIGPSVLPVPRIRRRATFARVRRESIEDGCLNEARAAEELRGEAERQTDARIREMLSRIADDEDGHVRLAEDVVRFCTERDRMNA